MKGNMTTQELQKLMREIGDAYRAERNEMSYTEGCRKSRQPEEKSNELTVFRNGEFGNLDVVIINGEPYFPATDCARILGYKDPKRAIRTHCKGAGVLDYPLGEGEGDLYTPLGNGGAKEAFTPRGGIQKRKYISESNLYRLIAHSRLSAAERFEAWVMEDVLPSIRKTGGYIYGEERMTSEQLKRATKRVLDAKLGQRLNEKMGEQAIDLPTFVQKIFADERVSWNPAQMMNQLLWRYLSVRGSNDLKGARYELYGYLNEYCGICLWERKSEAAKVDREKGTRPMYAFLTRQEESLALLFALAMCAYSGAAIGDIVRAYC